MSFATQTSPAQFGTDELSVLRRSWGWLFGLGIAMVIVGTLAVMMSFVATLATVVTIGSMLLVGGAIQLVNAAIARRKDPAVWLHVLAGILYLVLGVMMLRHPLLAAAAFTLMMSALFLVSGAFRIVIALSERFHGRGWIFLSGVISLALGIMIWAEFPASSLFVLGLFVGIDMIFAGWASVMMAIAVRSLARPAT